MLFFSMILRNKHIVVTGGAGFIGSHLVDALIKENPEKITVMSNFFVGSKNNLARAEDTFPSLEILNQDVTKYEEVEDYFKNNSVDTVFNLAVIPIVTSLTEPAWTFKNNVEMSSVFCELLRKDYFKKLVQFSSSEVYGTAKYVPMDENHPLNPETPYAASKAATDHLALSYFRTFGSDISLVRPFNNYGPRQSATKFVGLVPGTILRAMKDENVIIQGDGEQTRDYIFVEDTAEGAIKVAKSNNTKGKAINIATGREISIGNIINEILNNFDYKGKIVHTEARLGDVRRHLAKIDLARDLIDFEAKTSLSEGMKKTVDWYKKNISL